MKRPVLWTHNARQELLEIAKHIAHENPSAAKIIRERINQAANALSDLPTGRAGRVIGTYEKVLPSLPYILAYEILSQTKSTEAILILHVIHGARDWPAEEWPKE